eukprot:CAMPEP_0116559928 /NCGR_PEP_ID=MMETSP0397-20121206/10684_1 /TAXON_ID=216820 /ORGANISM="Cyclophora tenuis, Strain ECT3854" /LENGTH=92 /DNA_ID=CAMNT_0004085783 /DNA_START=16 /DNA_END=294 /DNA_ORIENTATION=-
MTLTTVGSHCVLVMTAIAITMVVAVRVGSAVGVGGGAFVATVVAGGSGDAGGSCDTAVTTVIAPFLKIFVGLLVLSHFTCLLENVTFLAFGC